MGKLPKSRFCLLRMTFGVSGRTFPEMKIVSISEFVVTINFPDFIPTLFGLKVRVIFSGRSAVTIVFAAGNTNEKSFWVRESVSKRKVFRSIHEHPDVVR